MSDYPEDDGSNYNGGAPASLVGGLTGQQFYNQNHGQGKTGHGGGGGYGYGGGGRGYPPTDGRY